MAFTGTFGLEVTSSGLTVFGSALPFGASVTQGQPSLASAMPGAYVYQQLKHPVLTDDTTVTYDRTVHRMTQVVASCNFNGKAVVAAKFTDGNTFLFYNGSLIQASRNGIVLSGKTSLASLGTDLARQANAFTGWRGVANVDVAGNTVNGEDQVFSAVGTYFGTPVASKSSASGLQADVNSVAKDGAGTAGTPANASVLITGNGTLNVLAAAVSLTNGAVAAGGTTALTAAAVTAAINNNTIFTGYSATVSGSTITVFAPVSLGAAANSVAITTTGTATVTLTSGPIAAGLSVVVSPVSATVTLHSNSFNYTYAPGQPTASASGGTIGTGYTFTWIRVNADGSAFNSFDAVSFNSSGPILSVNYPTAGNVPSQVYFKCKVTDSVPNTAFTSQLITLSLQVSGF